MLASLFGSGFSGGKCKTSLRLAMGRLKLMRGKRAVALGGLRREIAGLLKASEENVNAGEQARIRVESVLREEAVLAAYEVLEIFCELLAVRMPLIEQQKECPVDLREAVATVLYAAPRLTELVELKKVAHQLAAKYGRDYAKAATNPATATDCGCNPRIVKYLGVEPPAVPEKLAKLSEIAAEHNVDWSPREGELDLTSPGAQATVIGGSSIDDQRLALEAQAARRAGTLDEPLLDGEAYVPPPPVPFGSLEPPPPPSGMAAVPPPPSHTAAAPPPSTTAAVPPPAGGVGAYTDAAAAASAAADHARAAERAAEAAAKIAGTSGAGDLSGVPWSPVSPPTADELDAFERELEGTSLDDAGPATSASVDDAVAGLPDTPVTSPDVRPTHDEHGFPLSPNATPGGEGTGNEDTLAARLSALKKK